MKRLEEEALTRGDRRSGRLRKLSAKAADIQNIIQQSNMVVELAYLAAQNNEFNIPNTIEEALKTPQADKWLEAYESEMNSLTARGTFSGPLDKIPLNKSAVTAKIILDLKRGENNEISRFKARLVARGFTQKYGVDFEEKFAPTIRLDAFRIILAITAKEKWDIYQMDVVTEFLVG